jgi:hypothetical protein
MSPGDTLKIPYNAIPGNRTIFPSKNDRRSLLNYILFKIEVKGGWWWTSIFFSIFT